MAEGPIWIDRKDRERVIKVEADTFRRSLGEIRNDVEPEIRKLDVPPGITVRFGGTAEEQSKAFADIRLMLVVGVLLVYMVMAGQFESLTIPFVIMFSVPYAFTGAIWALVFTRTPINLVALIGLVLLVGVVVNNAIVLVDYTNILRARGYGLNDALITAGTRRLRPVLMTTLTTIFGLVPLAISRGQGSEMWQPFGITVIGGLSLSTIVTLALVPVMYSFMARRIRGFSA
jgi:HAE1 family hydrophobic/amphiphilic exporter-1